MAAAAAASVPMASATPGVLFVHYLQRLDDDASAAGDRRKEEAQQSAAAAQQQQHAIRLMCELVCGSGGGASVSTAWSVLAAVWAEVDARMQALQSATAAAAAGALSSGTDGDAPAGRSGAARGNKQRKGAGQGGQLPPAQAAQLERTRAALAAERRLAVFLQATRVMAAWMAAQSMRADGDSTALVERAAAGVMQLLRAEHTSSHGAVVGVVCELARLCAPLQQQLQSCCLNALNGSASAATGSAAMSSSAPAVAGLSAAHAHPRPLCMLLCALLDECDEAFNARVWSAAVQALQNSPSALLRQQVLRVLLPPLLLQKDGSSKRLERLHTLSTLYHSMWEEGVRQCNLPTGTAASVAALSPFAASPFLGDTFLSDLLAQQPQLAHLYDVLCALFPDMLVAAAADAVASARSDAQSSAVDAWVLDVVLAGLASGHAVYKKQSLYLLQVRQMLREQAAASSSSAEASAPASASFVSLDYTAEQWSCFQQLFQTLEGTSLHLVQSVYPRIQMLFDAPRYMDAWLELLVRQSCLHAQPSIASAAFQQMHALCQADTALQRTRAAEAAQRGEPVVPDPPRLRPAIILGTILLFFDEPSLFGVDKERTGVRRLGDMHLAPFLIDFMERLPRVRDGQSASAAAAHSCTRKEFMREFILWLCPLRASSSVGALAVQMRALAKVEASHCLEESDVVVLLALKQGRLAKASVRVRPLLTLSMLQVFARHVNFAADISPTLVARLLLEFPADWMRTNCSALQLLQQADQSGGWLERHLPGHIASFFAELAAPAAEKPGPAPVLLAHGADMSSVHDGYMRLLLLVPEDSPLEGRLLSELDRHIRDCFATLSASSSPSAALSLLQLFHFLCTFYLAFTRSRQAGVDAARHSDRPDRETLAVPDAASSASFLQAQPQAQGGALAPARDVALSWETRLRWSESLINELGVACVERLHALVAAQQGREDLGSDAEALRLSRSLVSVLSLLLVHSSMRAYKHRLLASLLRVLLDSKLFTALPASGAGCDRPLLYGLIFAVLTCCDANDWAPADQVAGSDNQSQEATVQLVEQWTTEAEKSADSPLLFPPAVAVYLACHLVEAQLANMPAAVSANDWKAIVQQFHLHRWQSVRRLLEVSSSWGGASTPDLLEVCVESLDGRTELFVEHVYHCIRMLLPLHLQRIQSQGAPISEVLQRIEWVYRASWSAFRGMQQKRPSYTAVIAFHAIIFEPSSVSLLENHAEGAPFRSYFDTLLSYGLHRPRFLFYFTTFATLSWLRFPHLLPSYTAALLRLCVFRADTTSEVELVEEKMRAFEIAHMIHNFGETTKESVQDKSSVIRGDNLRRGESLVRCVALHLVQQLPQILESLCESRRAPVEQFLFDFAGALINHPSMQSERGGMLGEGNNDFVNKAYLWQTMCVLVPSVRVAGSPSRRAQLHDLLQRHTWQWFERPLTSVLRQLLEVFLCNLYGLAPERIGSELAPTLQAHMSRPTLLASVVLVLAFATLSIRDEGVRAIQAKRTLRLLHPYVGCNFGHVRLVVQYLYHRLVTELCPPEWNAPVSSSSSSSSSSNSSSPIGPGDEESSCVSSLMTYLSVDPDLSRLRLRQDSYFEQFSPWRGCTVQGMMANGDEHHHFLHRPLLDQIASLQGQYLSSLHARYDDMLYPAPGAQSTDGPIASASAASAAPAPAPAAAAAAAGGLNFQQKIEVAPLAQLTAMGDVTGDSDQHKTDQPQATSVRSAVEQRTNAPRQSVIVIASLVDKLPNLAGLSRTCEIFQAERLMLSDLSVVHESDFKSISVTAHQWLPMEALPVAGIADFIRARQAEGYTCIALEQSAASVQLPAYQFPSRVVILLGAEKEGVPVDLLNLVDQCVEIPQLGIIRSLNVHVSASILLWEYTRQAMLGLVAQSAPPSS